MRQIKVDAEHFTMRLLQDCLAQATATYWHKRADDFERARPTPDEFHGHASPIELAARDEYLAGIARACRARATLALQCTEAPEVDHALREAG